MYDKATDRREDTVSRGVAVLGAGLALVVGFFLGFTVHGMLLGSPRPAGPDVAVQSQPGATTTTSSTEADTPISEEAAARIRAVERQVQLEPANAAAWTQLGNLYYDTKQPQKAIAAYGRSLSLRPDDPNVLTDQGVMYRKLGDFDKALECFNKAIALDPAHIIAQFNKSIVLEHDKHDKAGALAALKNLAAHNPNAILPGGSTVGQAIQELSAQ